MTFSMNFWILFGVALICCAIGFYKYVYFISIGYGAAIAGQGAALLVLFHKQLGFPMILVCILMIVYGFRLSGYLGIIFVMFSGARRLEVRQNKNYGDDPEYQKYVKTVPIMVPFVPLYSVEKYKFLVL